MNEGAASAIHCSCMMTARTSLSRGAADPLLVSRGALRNPPHSPSGLPRTKCFEGPIYQCYFLKTAILGLRRSTGEKVVVE
jgi:hypothetical protein